MAEQSIHRPIDGGAHAGLDEETARARGWERFDKAEVEQSIGERFARQVARHGGKAAVRTREGGLTYEQLEREANRLANAVLAARGEGEEPIGLHLGNGTGMIAAMLGMLKAGKIYVPLDTSISEGRARYILEDSGAQLVVTSNRNLPQARAWTEGAAALLNVDEIASDVSVEAPGLAVSPETRTWLLYTSGSTGDPKGVSQTHRNVLHYVMNYTNGLMIGSLDRLSLLFSCAVNGGAHDIFTALLTGASLHAFDIRSEGLAPLARWLEEEGVTIYCSVPTVFRHFAELLTGEGSFPAVRVIKLIGEPVYRRDVEAYKRFFPDTCVFVNRLGSTETGSICWYFVDKGTTIDGNNVPVGFPTPDNEVVLLEEEGWGEVAEGEVGEIAVRSAYLSPGYWNRPELTARAFREEPTGSGERTFRTGDIGRMDEGGCLVHLGRKDFQVKIRGYRVETGEVEAALVQVEGVKDAVVMGRTDEAGEVRLVAYLVNDSTTLPTVTALRGRLSVRLPEYMIPSFFVEVEALPRAPNGKVDRKALPAPGGRRPELDAAYEEARTPAEEQLVWIWEEVLGVQPVGIGDDFFDLGGDSLLAVRLFERIEKRMGRRLPLMTLSEAPTVKGLAAILREEEPETGGAREAKGALVAIRAGGGRIPFFCVPPAATDVLTFAPLSRHLGEEQPLYGLQPVGLDGEETPHASVEEMARHYVKEILAFRPHGPYLVGGRCFGGFVAFEMARILQEEGHDAPFVVLLESSQPPPAISLWTYLRGLLSHHLPKGQFLYCLSRDVVEKLRILRWRFDLTRWGRRVWRVWSAHRKARRAWKPERYSGMIMLIQTPEFEKRFPEYRTRWETLALGGLERAVIPGAHRDLLREPHVKIVAEQLRAWFARLEEPAEGSTP